MSLSSSISLYLLKFTYHPFSSSLLMLKGFLYSSPIHKLETCRAVIIWFIVLTQGITVSCSQTLQICITHSYDLYGYPDKRFDDLFGSIGCVLYYIILIDLQNWSLGYLNLYNSNIISLLDNKGTFAGFITNPAGIIYVFSIKLCLSLYLFHNLPIRM